MNWNRVQGNWKQLKGKMKARWGKVSGDRSAKIAGNTDQATGKAQATYADAKQEAEEATERLGKTNKDDRTRGSS